MTADVNEWDNEPSVDDPAVDEPAARDADGPELQPLAYPTLVAWVEGLLAPMYRRAVDGRATTWCPEWWRHAEALTRLEAIWRAWEHLRLDPMTGISVWFTMHADPHMAVLLDPAGPFTGCTPTRGHRTDNLLSLPTVAAPTALFSPV